MISIKKYFTEADAPKSFTAPKPAGETKSPTVTPTTSYSVSQPAAQPSQKTLAQPMTRTPLNIQKPQQMTFKPIQKNPFLKPLQKPEEKKEEFKPMEKTASLLGPKGYA